MILWDDTFFTELDDSRICYIGGRLRAGKSMLAMQLAENYLKQGYKLMTNMLTVWSDDWVGVEKIGKEGVKAVALVDEAGLYLRSMASVSQLSSFAAKLDMYIILAGKREPHEELVELTVTPWVDIRRNFGIPLYLWRWDVNSGKKAYHGYLLEGLREGFYGVYSTANPGDRPKKLLDQIDAYAKRLSELYGNEYGISDVATGGGIDPSLDAIIDAGKQARGFREAISLLAREKKGKRI